jgi:hypothetical protein
MTLHELNGWLDAHTRAATVHLLPYEEPGLPMWGSGFCVAPGWVLTAAHVLMPHLARNRELTFAVRGGTEFNDGVPVPARLEQWLADGRRDRQALLPEEDLALVRLLDDAVRHACVWIPDRAVQYDGPVRAYGYYPGPPDAASHAVPWSGATTINQHDAYYGLRPMPDIEFPDGVSGGPMLDPDSGAVVALIKARRGARDGGLAVSMLALRRFGATYGEVMRAHDAWHGRSAAPGRSTWISAQHAVVTGGRPTGGEDWTPRDRQAALYRLAALPPPPDGPTVRMLARAAISGGDWPHPQEHGPKLYSWRDGHGLLYDGSRPMGSLNMLRYLKLVTLYERGRDRDTTELAEWIDTRLDEHPWPGLAAFVTEARLPESLQPGREDLSRVVIPYPGAGEGTTVAVLLDPVIGSDPTRFFWQIWIDDGDGEPALYEADRSWHGHRPGELMADLGPKLIDVFHDRDRAGRPVPLEVALPPQYFNTAVHRWRLYDRLHDHPLGAQRRVVLRSLERRGDPDDLWTTRWQAMAACTQLTGWQVADMQPDARRFRETGPAAVPVICRSVAQGPGRQAVQLALDGGHGVLLWRLDGHDGAECQDSCAELHARTRWLFEPLRSAAQLPDRLRQLRQEITDQRADHRWAEPLVLLYDDPGRPLPAEDSVPVDAPS